MGRLTSRIRSSPGRTLATGLLLLSSLWSATPTWATSVLLTGSDDSHGVQAFTQALARQRPDDNVRFVALSDMPPPGQLPNGTRLILLDRQSLDWRLQDAQGPWTLVLRISRLQAAERPQISRTPRLNLLWSDPPLNRQLHLIRRVLPQVRRVGVLYGQHSEFLLKEARSAGAQLGLEIVAERWDSANDSRVLQTLLKNSDVLMGLDDPELYNPKTAKNLLLSSYARHMALIGPNAGFVRAGSLASTYSDQQDWLKTLNTLLDQPPARWPTTLYPRHFKVMSNPQVARSLGIEEIDETSVASDLAEGEQRP